MVWRITTAAFALIVAAAAAAAVFRVVTAPERVQKRMETAKETCIKSGGTWAFEGREPICKRT